MPDSSTITGLLPGIAFAFWIGLLASISPCPLATNIAAVSFVGRRVGSTAGVLAAGLLYTAGRMLVYVALGVLLVQGLLSDHAVSQVVLNYMNKLLGPIFIMIGMILTGLLQPKMPSLSPGEGLRNRAESWGLGGAFLLGILFALAFCPVTAALFFSLVPVAARFESGFVLPSVFGFGTGLPVVCFAVIAAFGTKLLGEWFNRVTAFEKWARLVAGIIFIGLGVCFCLAYIFRMF